MIEKHGNHKTQFFAKKVSINCVTPSNCLLRLYVKLALVKYRYYFMPHNLIVTQLVPRNLLTSTAPDFIKNRLLASIESVQQYDHITFKFHPLKANEMSRLKVNLSLELL